MSVQVWRADCIDGFYFERHIVAP